MKRWLLQSLVNLGITIIKAVNSDINNNKVRSNSGNKNILLIPTKFDNNFGIDAYINNCNNAFLDPSLYDLGLFSLVRKFWT